MGSIGDVGYQGHGIGVYEHYAYVVDGGANLHIFDVSNPARPVEVNRVGTENFCSQVLTLTNFVTDYSAAGIQAGTSGAITDAPPQLADAMRTADGAFSFTLRGVPEGTYFIQASADLISWANISTNSLPLGGTLPRGKKTIGRKPHFLQACCFIKHGPHPQKLIPPSRF